jgi:CRISPR/Cas system CSM-associated protein Csm4 (group 5 of RAMP superfamily)
MKDKNQTKKINMKYLPKNLSLKDKKIQSKMLEKSQKMYKKGKYYTRKRIHSFHSKKSKHLIKALKMYDVQKIGSTDELAKKTKCSKASLQKIINKGQGAYYSSGSRPNQTSQSWGVARLASALTSGKAAIVDYDILEKGCQPSSKALQLAKKLKNKTSKLRKSRKTTLLI